MPISKRSRAYVHNADHGLLSELIQLGSRVVDENGRGHPPQKEKRRKSNASFRLVTILESHQDELLDEIGLYGYEFVQGGGPFGNTLEYRPGAQWLVLEAVHYDGSKKAVRVPIHDRFAQDDHLERLRYVSATLKEQDADWFPSFEIKEYDFGGEVDLSPCPVMVMDGSKERHMLLRCGRVAPIHTNLNILIVNSQISSKK